MTYSPTPVVTEAQEFFSLREQDTSSVPYLAHSESQWGGRHNLKAVELLNQNDCRFELRFIDFPL